jgi:hypothetical protein
VPRVLTSAAVLNVREGMVVLSELVAKASERIIVMPGGGLREDHVTEVVRTTRAREVHATAFVTTLSEAYRRPEVAIRSRSLRPMPKGRTWRSVACARCAKRCWPGFGDASGGEGRTLVPIPTAPTPKADVFPRVESA